MSAVPEEMSAEMLRRREVLKRAALLLGGALSAPAILGVLQGCSSKDSAAPAATWRPKFLSAAQGPVIAQIAEIMIPKTDTSGAREAGVPAFIDLMLADVYPQEDQERFNAGFAQFAAAAQASGGKPFLEQTPAARTALVKQSLAAALAGIRTPKPFMLMTRELTLLGFFNSKVGITEFMDYRQAPGAYHGCEPLSQLPKHTQWKP